MISNQGNISGFGPLVEEKYDVRPQEGYAAAAELLSGVLLCVSEADSSLIKPGNVNPCRFF